MGGFVSEKMIKTAQRLQRRLSVFPMYAHLSRPTVLSLEAGGTQLRCYFPVEAIPSQIQVEKCVMNDTVLTCYPPVSYMPCVTGSTFNVQRTFYSIRHHIKSVRGKGMTCCPIFFRSRSVDSPRPGSPPCSQQKGQHDMPSDQAGYEVYPQSSANGRVKSSEKERDKM
ncbi:hypothetical protein ARMGADRAFT_775259 [Armillaria gallica]|uniref:Uncharacterized protein n=1 Tax=Armillaria gallica TaxID=47427 RepID=A0A2H3C7L1_ARMGA|nr:hypothetical protein ARMGADRAFT_288594 [Armillaria gallica]PBK81807.1 hypothetical protein ARMGADRAFT_775259 [Armillaria gallica]